jgi:hypothetical protein
MPSSHESPQPIQIDFGTLKHGTVTILVHWNITPVEITDQMSNEPVTRYEYQEARIDWILPAPFTTKEEIQSYFDANYDTSENILNWAQATKVSSLA